MIFDAFFKKATEYDPFPFQKRFAEADEIPNLVNVPTGLGKTAMAIVGWLWRRFEAPEVLRRATPRRLVYTLPMRVLVEQTRDNAIRWLQNLNLLGGRAQWDNDGRVASYEPSSELPGKVAVYVLMGGEEQYDWEIYPEREAILIGTQDMLLSRALNRGYAASRSRWPMQFGLLHTDALWVFDEVQLMGEGLATSAQLEAFRHMLGRADGHGTRSVWMSATLQKEWLQTVDFRERAETFSCLSLDTCDKEKAAKRWNASKKLQKTAARQGDSSRLAKEIQTHHRPGTLTLVVVNTVARARELYDRLSPQDSKTTSKKTSKKTKNKDDSVLKNSGPELVLLHSRFRPIDRARQIERALRSPGATGTIVISTQVVEAGVDISATNLFTEVAPWASLIQRFGRCNRKGENANASIWWIPLPKKLDENDARPYRLNDLTLAAEQLESLNDKKISLQSLDIHCRAMAPEVLSALFPYTPSNVLRRKDLIELFDTTPDLAGNDLDIDRFIRDVEDSDIHVFWHDFGKKSYPGPDIAPKPEELCPVPLRGFSDFAKTVKAWRWNFLDECWEVVSPQQVVPGQIVLLHKSSGGYTPDKGWDPTSRSKVPSVSLKKDTLDATDVDKLTTVDTWKTIAEHSDDVVAQMKDLLDALPFLQNEHRILLETAARWHDRGKAHPVFQAALPEGAPADGHLWAKAKGQLKKYAELGRPHFRHELASAMAVLMLPPELLPPECRDLVAYLVAAHHGKVRLSIRSLPGEKRPDFPADGSSPELRYARGIWEGDTLPETDLGGGIKAPAVTLSLEPMELGLCGRPPFEREPSWAERMVRLRDRLGPFHLAFLEAIARAADWRASRTAGKGSEQ